MSISPFSWNVNVFPPGRPKKIDQPWGHVFSLFRLVPDQFDNPSAIGPAGTVHVSIEDWTRFTRIFTESGRKQTPILDAATIGELATLRNERETYARGWLAFHGHLADFSTSILCPGFRFERQAEQQIFDVLLIHHHVVASHLGGDLNTRAHDHSCRRVGAR